MNDFTLVAYKQYLQTIKFSFENILRFDEFFAPRTEPESFSIIRDGCRQKVKKALRVARLENKIGLLQAIIAAPRLPFTHNPLFTFSHIPRARSRCTLIASGYNLSTLTDVQEVGH